jgi:uroporphyrinogen decarboxylase
MDLIRSLLKLNFPRLHKPNFERFRHAILTKEPGPVPVGEIFADIDFVGGFLNQRVVDYSKIASDPDKKISLHEYLDGYRYIRQSIEFCLNAGWDYSYSFSLIPFPGMASNLANNTANLGKGRKRFWVNDREGPINTWQDFEQYPWPTDFSGINLMSRIMAKRVPEGMKVMVIPGGVFEWTSQLMGLVNFSYALVDQPDLVNAVIQKVTETIYQVTQDILQEPNIGGVFMGDDLGYFSGTIISPRILREKFLPNTKKIIDLVHQAGRVFIFHTCGNMYSIMDDLIQIGIDAKHSIEDKIMPVEEVYQKWGDRIAIIGGVDMDILARGTEAQVRNRSREILDACGQEGHYVFGTGNSIANYIPVQNYLTMLDELHKWNKEHFGSEH